MDDDASVLSMMSEALDLFGYRVSRATNGMMALEQLDGGLRPCVILLDMAMPVMDGWQFASAYRSRLGKLAPIVVVTASADAEARARDIHADAFLCKPFDIYELVRVVEGYRCAETCR